MLCLDVNVLVHAANRNSHRHQAVRDWLGHVLTAPEPVVIPDVVTTGFVRIVTSPHVMPAPLTPDQAFALVDWLLSHARTMSVSGDEQTRVSFRRLVMSLSLRGNDVPDAWIAAIAMTTNATLVTFDRGFRRFPGLRVVEP
jgi:toxin-antitoxin system PIN domain toxin